MVLSPHALKVVYGKTDGRCALCGETENLTCTGFIPTWTRIPYSIDNMIPLCDTCRESRGYSFIEIGKLRYLDTLYIQSAMRFYSHEDKYLRMYVRRFGQYRTVGKLDTDYALQVLSSYDEYLRTHKDELDWESL